METWYYEVVGIDGDYAILPTPVATEQNTVEAV